MNKPKVKFMQAETLQDLEDKINAFLATSNISRSLSSKYIGVISNYHTMSIIYLENDYDRD